MAEGLRPFPTVRHMGFEHQRTEPEGSDHGTLILLIGLMVFTVPAAHYVNSSVPSGYMDEEFHLNQVEHYCRGDFAYWDSKITTLPGLYLASLVYLEILLPGADYFGYASNLSELCSKPAALRSVNLVLFGVCALLFREIALQLDPEKNTLQATLKAFVLSLYPLHWFFTLFYYTEMASAAAVMAMYLFSLQRSYWISALCGALAVLFRQTNAVWVLFVICVGVLDFLENLPLPGHDHDDQAETREADDGTENERVPILNQPVRNGVRHRRPGARNPGPNAQPAVNSGRSTIRGGGFQELGNLLRSGWFHRNAVLRNFGPLLLVLLAFIGFVIKDGSVVVGDKDAHKPLPHFPQILYCGLVCTAFQPAVHFNPQRKSELLGALKRKAFSSLGLGVVVATIFAAISVHFYSDPHPYLLADNRHFTFYIWKDLVRAHWSVKYLVIPFYIYSWSSILSFLAEFQKPLWIAAFCMAVAGVLVPSPLLEVRYYSMPFYFIFLHMSTKTGSSRLFFTPLLFIFINFLTVYVFLNWTFEWPNQPGVVQRFMW